MDEKGLCRLAKKWARMSRVRGFDRDDVENLLLFRLFKLNEAHPTMPDGEFEKFVAASMKNEIRMYKRKPNLLGVGTQSKSTHKAKVVHVPRNILEEKLISPDQPKQNFEEIIQSLPAEEKAMVRAIYSEGQTLKQYAEAKGIPYHAAYQTLQTVLEKLREEITEEDQAGLS